MMRREVTDTDSKCVKKHARGSVLACALLFLALLALTGAALIDRAVHGSETAAWSRDHLILRTLAESAADELSCTFQIAANSPEHPQYQSLRKIAGQGVLRTESLQLTEFERDRPGQE